MFTRDELSEDAIRAHLETVEVDEKTRMLLLNLVHKISDLEDEALDAGEAMQALVDAGLEMHKQGWEKCREEAIDAVVRAYRNPRDPDTNANGRHDAHQAIRALEYSNE